MITVKTKRQTEAVVHRDAEAETGVNPCTTQIAYETNGQQQKKEQ